MLLLLRFFDNFWAQALGRRSPFEGLLEGLLWGLAFPGSGLRVVDGGFGRLGLMVYGFQVL